LFHPRCWVSLCNMNAIFVLTLFAATGTAFCDIGAEDLVNMIEVEPADAMPIKTEDKPGTLPT
jgi:hypothetical protein